MSYTVGEKLQKQLKAKKLLDDAITKLNIAYKPLREGEGKVETTVDITNRHQPQVVDNIYMDIRNENKPIPTIRADKLMERDGNKTSVIYLSHREMYA